jgi:hypothetical protein
MTTDDLETIALRPTVIGGARQDDDFEVIWRGFPVGRIMKPMDSPHWWWACTVYGLPPTPNDRGPAINFKDCQVRFRLAWARIRPTLTDEAIQTALRHAEGLLEQQAAKEAQPKAPEPLQVLDNHRVAPRHRVLRRDRSSSMVASSTAPFEIYRIRVPRSKSPARSAFPIISGW